MSARQAQRGHQRTHLRRRDICCDIFFDHICPLLSFVRSQGGSPTPQRLCESLPLKHSARFSVSFTSLRKVASDTTSDRLVRLLLLVPIRTSVTSLVDLASLELTPGKLSAPKAPTSVMHCSQDKDEVHEDANCRP